MFSVNIWSKIYTYSVQPTIPKCITHKVDNKLYTTFDSQEFYEAEIGNPKLPLNHYCYYIPNGEKLVDVRIALQDPQNIVLENSVLPVQEDIPISNLQNSSYNKFVINQAAYNSANKYPNRFFDFVVNCVRGNTFVDIYIVPQYIPLANTIVFGTTYKIIIETTPTNNKTFNHLSDAQLSVLRQIVDNPEDLVIDSLHINKVKKSVNNSGLKYYEYTVITRDSLKEAFSTLIHWKKRKGYNAGVVTIEEILASGLQGDEISGIYDDAGKIRQYLYEGYQQNAISFVLLGGDSAIVPIRYGTGNTDASLSHDIENQIPSDLYFSDFDSDWNTSGTDIYGLQTDNMDYASEIAVGRLLCICKEDIITWTNKQLIYEQNPGFGDYSYLQRALFTQGDEMRDEYKAESVAALLPNFNVKILNEIPGTNSTNMITPTGNEIIDSINTYHYGLLSNFHHGSPCYYSTITPEDIHDKIKNRDCGIVAMNKYDEDDHIGWIIIPETANGFDNLTNDKYPAIMYSISCTNMPFDNYQTPTVARNLAESFTCMNKGGGIAYLGNTRSGWVTSSSNLYKEFAKILPQISHIGIVEAMARQTFMQKYYHNHWVALAHNLVGCPETPFWNQTPSIFTDVVIERQGTSLYVHPNVTNAKICITSLKDYGDSYFSVIETSVNQSYSFTNVPTEYCIVITKDNYIPYIYTSSYYIQNEIFQSNETIEVSSIIAGRQVTETKPIGDVIVQPNATLTLKADSVTLDSGFEVKSGGALIIE